MVPRVETHVLGCAEGGHACLGNPLPWLLQGPFLGTKATLQISISGVCYSLWVGSVDGFPCLYEGLLAEMEEAWECTDIDFFIPVHTLMYWLLCRSVRNMLFATGWGGSGRRWTKFCHTQPQSQRPYPFHFTVTNVVLSLWLFRENILLWLFLSVKCCRHQFSRDILTLSKL